VGLIPADRTDGEIDDDIQDEGPRPGELVDENSDPTKPVGKKPSAPSPAPK